MKEVLQPIDPDDATLLSLVHSRSEVSIMGDEILIVFPPTTEARLFPYLSLPMITSYLRKRDVPVVQKDLNIELCHQLFSADKIGQFISLLEKQGRNDLQHRYRLEMAKFLWKNQRDFFSQVFDKQYSSLKVAHRNTRFVRQGIEMLLENSILKEQITSLDEIGKKALDYQTPSEEDIAALTLYESFIPLINRLNPRVFAVSIAYYSQILPSLLLARWVKDCIPDTFVIFGGQQIMLRHEDMANIPAFRRYVDGLGTGAGEETMLRLWQYLTGGGGQEKVPDVVWLQDSPPSQPSPRSTVHIQNVPPPDFSDLPFDKYLSEEVNLSLITCIGCYWGRCAFCSYGNRSRKQQNYQQKTARQIADECQYLLDKHQVKRINFIDENTNLRLVVHAMRILNQRGYRMQFSTRNRMEECLLDLSFCKELKERGCVLMSVGYETNSQRLLDLLDKGVQAAHYQQIIDNLHQVNIPLRLSVMGGILDETEEELRASEEFLIRNAHKIGIDVMQMLVAEPKTYLTESPEKYNIKIKSKTKLRGNQLLNYGMGRMGYDFDYVDGDTFEPRLQNFLTIFRNVKPQKNDELPPDARFSGQDDDWDEIGIKEIELLPWVKVIQAPLRSGQPVQTFIVDMLWQRFFRIPDLLLESSGQVMRTSTENAEGMELLKRLVKAGMGRVITQA